MVAVAPDIALKQKDEKNLDQTEEKKANMSQSVSHYG